jgi:hypothetical protein
MSFGARSFSLSIQVKLALFLRPLYFISTSRATNVNPDTLSVQHLHLREPFTIITFQ